MRLWKGGNNLQMPWEKVKMGEETMNQIQIPMKEKIQTNMNMNKYKKIP